MQKRLADWPELHRYQADNARIAPTRPGEPRVVSFGDSITDGWAQRGHGVLPGKSFVNLGISGD